MTPKRPTGRCRWCEGQIPSYYRADRKTCSDVCRGAFRRAGNPRRHLSWRYGITPADREAMAEAQGRRCVICERHEDTTYNGLHVDHDHETGRVRKLLCADCNTALGRFRDDPAALRRAAAYVEEFRHGYGAEE